ncbi:MAG: spore coat associated protein CotJA [Blautia sp.]|nr:spore coat associated protein CotJA [Blautia sp.]
MMDCDMNMTGRGRTGDKDDCANWVVGMAYVPWQTFGQTYDPKRALMTGTIFPELDMPFTGRCRGGRRR